VRPRHISVVTVCLNHKEGLRRTLANVAAQSWGNMNHVVIDGGSTDGSAELLELHRTSKPFTFVSEPDRGIYDAMNKGWQLADGDLVVFMNAGDTFASIDILERLARRHANESWRWGFGCARIIDASGQPNAIISFVPFRLDRLALGLSCVPHQATVMERELLKELGGFRTDVGIAADQELFLRAALKYPPRLWAEFFANLEGGGIGSTRQPGAYARDMGQFRADLRLYVAGGRVRDKFVTLSLALIEIGRTRLQDVWRRVGLRGN
jgi:glycosyltransferase involved in cell wall biosynthesis